MRPDLALATAAIVLTSALPGLAQDTESLAFTLGGDRYEAGRTVTLADAIDGDTFGAGERVRLQGPVGGSAYLIGRIVDVDAPVLGDVHAAGYDVTVRADIGGALSLTGAELHVAAPVAGNLRAAGAELSITADIGGSALLAAGSLMLDAVVGGDMIATVEDVRFGDAARIDGQVTLYAEDIGDVSVPASVADPARVRILEVKEAAQDQAIPTAMRDMGRRGLKAAITGFMGGVLVVALCAAAAVAIAPNSVAAMRARALAGPVRCGLAGFVSMSALVGAVLVLAFTVIGLVLVPFALALLGGMLFAGYVAGSYILGVGLWRAAGRDIPVHVAQKAGLAALGAALAGLLVLVPLLGWLAWFVLVFVGLGALTTPAFARISALSPRL